MWEGRRVVVIVPAWDEAPRVGRVVRGVPAWVDEIVVVDDASRDGTGDAARAVGDARVVVERHPHNRGVGATIVTGYRRAAQNSGSDRDAFVVMAGDGQMDPRDLPALVTPIVRGEADYAKGDRFGWDGESSSRMPAARKLAGRVFSWATGRAIGVPISDSQCGYTAMARGACAKIDLEALWPGYGYPNDLLSALALRGLRIVQVPVRPVYADEVSRLRTRHVPVVAGVIARAWVRRLRLTARTRFSSLRAGGSAFRPGPMRRIPR
jgi:glycosyltransferase involved in cell wall biosynthesis